jgi:D-arabinose 1-dehydrogenase-like Zn-dependent alcohol dehydrogenase
MITLRGSFVGSLEEMKEAAKLLAKKPKSGVPVSTRPMAEANAAIDDLRAGRVVGRVVLVP